MLYRNGSGKKDFAPVNPVHISEEEELEDEEEVDDVGISNEEDARSKDQSASELAMLQSANVRVFSVFSFEKIESKILSLGGRSK